VLKLLLAIFFAPVVLLGFVVAAAALTAIITALVAWLFSRRGA
jgi:hypothetical protein